MIIVVNLVKKEYGKVKLKRKKKKIKTLLKVCENFLKKKC